MSILLIDIGNTRIKWAFLKHPDDALGQVHHQAVVGDFVPGAAHKPELSLELLQALFAQWHSQARLLDNTPISAVFLVSVGAQYWRTAIEVWALENGVACLCLHAGQAMCGVVNSYHPPGALGADRWAMAIAVAYLFPGNPCVVASAGTATTVDAISSTGEFLGGLIIPGLDLMVSSLHQNTARLPLAAWQIQAMPENTDAAISTGVLDAQLGAIERFVQRFGQQVGKLCVKPVCILTGGHAPSLAEFLPEAVVVPHLVLQGVRFYAQAYFNQSLA
jgi:type III pantothenate kinase